MLDRRVEKARARGGEESEHDIPPSPSPSSSTHQTQRTKKPPSVHNEQKFHSNRSSNSSKDSPNPGYTAQSQKHRAGSLACALVLYAKGPFSYRKLLLLLLALVGWKVVVVLGESYDERDGTRTGRGGRQPGSWGRKSGLAWRSGGGFL